MISKFGVGFSNSLSIDNLLNYGRIAEKCGLMYWLNEGYYNRSCTVIMSALAVNSRTLELGLGVVSPLLRHPFNIAMEAATLDELSNGRLTLGLGIAASGARKHNIDAKKMHPVSLMKESATIIRTLLDGQKARDSNLFPAQKDGVQLGFNPTRHKIPLFLGAMNPQMLKLGGEYFDGIIFNYPCPLPYVRFALEQIREGIKTRPSEMRPPEIVAFQLVSVSDQHGRAVEASKKYLPHYLSRAYPITLEYAGVSREEIAPILRALQDGEHKDAASLVSDELVEKLTISGTPEECIKEIRKYSELGIDQMVAELIVGPDSQRAIETIAQLIAPSVLSKNTES